MTTRLTVGLSVAFAILTTFQATDAQVTGGTDARVTGGAVSSFGQQEPLPDFGTIHITPEGSIVRVNGILQGGSAPNIGDYVGLYQIRAVPNPDAKPAIRMALGRVEQVYSRQDQKIDFSLLMKNEAARSVAKLDSEAVHVKVAAPFQAVLLLIRADWSAVDDAEQVESSLRKALKGASVPRDLLDKLPASGPEILFPTEMVSLYEMQHFQDLMFWLEATQLVESLENFPPATLTQRSTPTSGFAGAIGTRRGGRGGFTRQYDTTMSKPYQWLHSTGGDDAAGDTTTGTVPRPFVTRRTAYNWSISEVQKISERVFTFVRTTGIMEHARGQPTKLHQELDKTYFECTIPNNHVAVTHAFPHQYEAHLRKAASERGFIPLIVSVPTSLAEVKSNEDGKLHLPKIIQTLTKNGNNFNSTVTPPPERVPMLGDIPPVGVGNSGLLGVSDFPKRANKAASGEVPAGLPGFDPATSNAPYETRLFRLKTTQAKAIESLVKQLFRDEITIGAEEASNSLLVRGTNKQLAELEKLVEMVDGKPEQPEATAMDAGNSIGHSDPTYSFYYGFSGRPKYANESTLTESPNDLRQMYADAETKAKQIAARLREIAADPDPSHTPPATIKNLRNQLRREVAGAFAARQKLQQAELANIRERTKELEQTIEVRERIKDKIIERRTQDLLNPNLRWETTPPGTAKTPAGTTQPNDDMEDVSSTEPIDAEDDLNDQNTIGLQGRWQIHLMKQGRDDFILGGKLTEDFEDDGDGDWFVEVEDSTFAIRYGRKNAVWLMASITPLEGHANAFELDDPNDPKPEHILGRFAVDGDSLRLCFKPDLVDGKPPSLMAGEKTAYLECTRARDRVTIGAVAN